ncbi:MAG: hypothetical protein K6F74_05655 [Prevotella sp.]|nr:hypothetical protein [Prevotella sp.]
MATITTDKATERVGRSVNGSTKKYADEKARAEINKIFTDLAYAGQGIGTCQTAATTAAKTVPISNFLLLKNSIIAVRFTAGIQVAAATLNVNSQGAKPIYLSGTPVQPGDVRAGQTAMMCYDGTNWNITAITGNESGGSDQDLYVDMGLPSGLLWAKRNIDVTQDDGFAASEYQYEGSFFSWGNVEPHNPTSNSSFAPYSFGSSNDEEPYVSSAGAKIGYPGNAGPSHDAARTILGGPWREPATEDFAELFNSSYTKYIDADGNDIAADVTDKRVTVNSIMGIRLKSKVNGNIIFFPCSGIGNGSSWNARGSYGNYWSRSLYSAANGRNLGFYSGGVYPQSSSGRFSGFPVRPVQ